ncbi:hypothetical protein JFL43_07425 [Viridibacillus sp. YIM B01967]|uniref:Response regulatory domain-containing protein n=1 Tax=Viridibacillus soli TaxID=2798301 RepID=A0ABS1H5K8_9BACL|nr:hypothetical protein [Viridibacillus soli]MBK3494689.1 hypothetical protein [Viridibacillus soli]
MANILIVNDNVNILNLVELHLEDTGCHVYKAHDESILPYCDKIYEMKNGQLALRAT